MPQKRNFKKGSVIYFEGERKNYYTYLLNKGVCVRSRMSIETGERENIRISVGDFFGVKASLGKFARDETVQVVTDCEVFIFNVQEFEQVIKRNTNIIVKMLKAFSNELRKIHFAIEAQMGDVGSRHDVSTVGKLKEIGEYYFKRKSYTQALYAYKKYSSLEPDVASEDQELQERIQTVESIINASNAEEANATAEGENVVSDSDNSTNDVEKVELN